MSLKIVPSILGFWAKYQGGSIWSTTFPVDSSTVIHSPGLFRFTSNWNTCGVVVDSIDIQPSSPVSRLIQVHHQFVLGQLVTLSGVGASIYSWSGGIIDNVPFSSLVTQTYTVTGIDTNGCIDTASINIQVHLADFPVQSLWWCVRLRCPMFRRIKPSSASGIYTGSKWFWL